MQSNKCILKLQNTIPATIVSASLNCIFILLVLYKLQLMRTTRFMSSAKGISIFPGLQKTCLAVRTTVN